MKVTFAQKSLQPAIQLTQNSVTSSGTLPILSNVLIDAADGRVDLIATDLESFARVSLEAEVAEGGRVTAPARTLGDIVRRLPDDNIALVSSGSRLTLTCNRNVFHLTSMSPDDFPDWPKAEPRSKITLRQADLKKMLHGTLFAIPQRDPRKVLMGSLFQLRDGKVACVATDGRKLGKVDCEPVEVIGDASFDAIIPGRVLSEIDKAIGEEGEIDLAVAERQAVFTVSNLTWLTSLIEGKFPRFESVIPSSFKKSLDLPRGPLSDAINRASVTAESKFNSIILSFQKNMLTVSSKSFEEGSYEGELEIAYDGEPFRIAFSFQYLHDVFRLIPDATIRMKIKDTGAPVVFQGESDPDSLYLIMPVRMHDIEDEEDEADED